MHLGTQQKLIFSSVERPNQDFELRLWILIWSVISKITIRIQRHKKEQSKFRIYNTAKTVYVDFWSSKCVKCLPSCF